MTKRRRKTLLQTTGYSVFPVLMVVEEEDDGHTTFQPIPLEGAIFLRWVSLLLAAWLQGLQTAIRKMVNNTSDWGKSLIERVALELKMGTILTRQLTLGVLSG
ncbi:MAG: hypothetical protein GY796_33920 [Chloroflexi bacterium]|nr:hypothetical protein [Chloroflexota bacterium]